MYLSKIFVPWQRARNPYNLHRQIWQLFPNRPDNSRDFLFRVEKQKKGIGFEVLMQSEHEPCANDSGIRIIANREYEIVLGKDQKIRFRLRANPVKTIKDESGRMNRKGEIKKCRVPLIREEEQKKWIDRKFQFFCSIDSMIIHQERPTYFRKKNGQPAGKIQTVLYDGILNVQEPDALLAEVNKGIGPAKSFGCGLLSMAKI